MIARVGRRVPLIVRTVIRRVRTANDEQVCMWRSDLIRGRLRSAVISLVWL
jgi:hypothetical protein